MATPATEQRMHIGTTKITASGSDQLSYWPASTRNTSTTAPPKTKAVVLPAMICRYISSVHSKPIDEGELLGGQLLDRGDHLARAHAGHGLPLMAAAGYML